MKQYLKIKDDVKKALNEGRPVVALESTIISHGMPYPENVTMAKKVEQIVRDNGAVPATIAIMDGKLKVGLTDEDLEKLAKEAGVQKTSKRDIPVVLTKKKTGATTVAATMFIANLAGIKVFVTGGIGGVHRGAQDTFDISADLAELFITPTAVVCAGVKSILDIGLTLEYLETRGVPVIGVDTIDFPAFYTSKSGFKADYQMNTDEIAEMVLCNEELGIKSGFVIANPIPKEDEIDADSISKTIETALSQAEEKGVKGKEITPFLLAKIVELTGGKSLEANLALVYNNAKIGAKIACKYSEMKLNREK